MTTIVVPIHPHEFEGFNAATPEDLPGTSDDELPTNDSVDEGHSALGLESNEPADQDHDSDMHDSSVDTPETAAPAVRQLGGLNNMGNTCYLNSALQMLASLDDFSERIKHQYDSKLRESLVDVLTKLRNGETVRPEEFKSVVDESSPLFVGYRQQDAHEFLTTLLDLLDEDFKKTLEPEKEEEEEKETDAADEEMEDGKVSGEAEPSEEKESVADEEMEDGKKAEETQPAEEETQPVSDEEMEDVGAEESPASDDDSYVVVEKEEATVASPIKKPRLDDGSDDENAFSSFKNLQFSDIETLLHGEKAESEARPEPPKETEPKCKLIGGRMSTAGVTLTPFEDGKCIPEETSVLAKSDPDESMSDETSNGSPIDYSFATEVRVCLTCDSCKYRRSHDEKYLHLSLEIGEHCSSIDEGLRKFFAPEKREIKCEKCFCETALQTTEITRLPRAMLFHLKRFIVNVSPDYTSISYSKDQSPVSFEESISFGEDSLLAEFLASDASLPEGSARYGIRSVVNHMGSSASCGHYTADARRRYDAGRKWTRFNDSIVSDISDREAVENSSTTAYMIMYEVGA